MKLRFYKPFLLQWGAAFLVFSCVTINIYFPEATVKKAADEIVEEIRKPEGQQKETKQSDKNKAGPVVGGLDPVVIGLVSFPAYAQQETEVSTPAIRALKESLKERFPRLRPYFEAGNIGEANDGYVQVRDEGSLSLKEKSELRTLVRDENNDRKNLYAEVARALNIDSSQIERVQKIFAQSWIEKTPPGWWIQKEDGEWVRKQ